MESLKVKEYLDNFYKGEYTVNPDTPDSIVSERMCNAGWYDWFCSERRLARYLKMMTPTIKACAKDNDVLNNEYRIWFKNNCPASDDPLYSDARFEPLDENERNKKYFVIIFDDHRLKAKFSVYNITFGEVLRTNDKKELVSFVRLFTEALVNDTKFAALVKMYHYKTMEKYYQEKYGTTYDDFVPIKDKENFVPMIDALKAWEQIIPQ